MLKSLLVLALAISGSLSSAKSTPVLLPDEYLASTHTYRATKPASFGSHLPHFLTTSLPAGRHDHAGPGNTTALAIEGGGLRSYFLALATERAQRILALAESEGKPWSEVEAAAFRGEALDDFSVSVTEPSGKRVPDVVVGTPGGAWGGAVIATSPTVMRRLGSYVDPEKSDFSLAYLQESRPEETLTNMMDLSQDPEAPLIGRILFFQVGNPKSAIVLALELLDKVWGLYLAPVLTG